MYYLRTIVEFLHCFFFNSAEKTLPMAIMILVYMITDVRTKADGSKVIYFTQVCLDWCIYIG